MLSLGRRLGLFLNAGDTVLLNGEMGAGKSVLIRGVARGLGIESPIPSPTFTIMNVHEDGRFPLYHFDFYRLSGEDEFYESGLDEFVPVAYGICAIEWADMLPGVLPKNALRISIFKTEQGREVQMEGVGAYQLPSGLMQPFEEDKSDNPCA